MARPRVDIDLEKIEALCRLSPTLKDVAAFFKVSEDTIIRRIKDETGDGFAAFRDKHMVYTRFDLVRKALKKVDKSDTMHIFCLKNLCKWKDKHEFSGDEMAPVNLTYTIKKDDK